ncbi:hypothetical protein [Streptomyces pyxinicus]|uniref:hypothetical protein n=1 Tax=Streptomyces pyxinicus TaxID=2970331 RepID=UPI00286809C0|nr:hypothetical protein [Streptomyces sp. LP11]
MGLTRPKDIEASGVAVTSGETHTPLQLTLSCRAPLRLTPHRNAGGAELPADACGRG